MEVFRLVRLIEPHAVIPKWKGKDSPFEGQDVKCPKCGATPLQRCINLVTEKEMFFAHIERIKKEAI